MVIVLIGVLAFLYYNSNVKLKLASARAELNKYAYIQAKRLKVLHQFFPEQRRYPRDPRFFSAIYDIDQIKIFSLLPEKDIRFSEEIYFTKSGRFIYFVKLLDEFYLGTRYLFVAINDDGIWKSALLKRITLYGLGAFVVLMLFGFVLAKLFVKPMRDAILLLDRFVKDTTHELNTPLSAVLANIEMMDKEVMVEKNRKKLERIHLAARMLSLLYKDLTYMVFEADNQSTLECIDLKALIESRAEYFKSISISKEITCMMDLDRCMIYADRKKIARLIDNLISNAIKYNKRQGSITVKLKECILVISDTGVGIDERKLPYIFDRYQRYSQSEGGFGVGLSIVDAVAKEFNIKIDVTSKKGVGTTFRLDFNKTKDTTCES